MLSTPTKGPFWAKKNLSLYFRLCTEGFPTAMRYSYLQLTECYKQFEALFFGLAHDSSVFKFLGFSPAGFVIRDNEDKN